MMLLALLLSSHAHAATLGNPVASAAEGQVRVGLTLSGEVPPGNTPELPAKGLRLDWVPADQLGLFVDGNWTNSLEDKVGGIRRRVWQLGAGGRLAVYPTRVIGFGVIGRASYGRDWTVQPFYLMNTASPTEVIGTGTTETTTTTTDSEPVTTTTESKSPLVPAWAKGVRTDEAQRLSGRAVAAMTLGQPGSGVYGWVGAHMSVNGVQQVGAVLGEGTTWNWSLNNRPIGFTAGFELASSDIIGWGVVRDRWLTAGLELHLYDATGAGLWLAYAW